MFKVGDKIKFSKETGYRFWDIETATGIIEKIFLCGTKEREIYEVRVNDIAFRENTTYPFSEEDMFAI
jgi:hypothetical protein